MHQPSDATSASPEVQREQQHLNRLYDALDAQRAALRESLAGTLRRRSASAQTRLETDVEVRRLAQQAAQHDAAEEGLCFGRIDMEDGYRLYIGRVGLRDEELDAHPPLVDWRAPAARAFYTATAATPQGVAFRRHLHTRGRRVVRVDDELLNDAPAEFAGDVRLNGEAALLAALRAERTGRMHDIVATLQAEQDRIIRSPHTGVLVVQGGPGTGKTVVALHRAAYLLYTHPRLDRRGVLVLGPNPVFLSYISQVLPGLGETNVLLTTVGELFPGTTATRAETAEAAEVKGRLVMADVVAAAVRAHEAAVREPIRTVIGGELIELGLDFLADAVERARDTRLPHNLARPVFCQAVIDEIARQLSHTITDIEAQFDKELAEHIDHAQLDRDVAADIISVFGEGTPITGTAEQKLRDIAASNDHWLAALPEDPHVQRHLDALWPELTPEQLLTELYADAGFLAEVAPQLTDGERAALFRAAGGGWTASDVPLLDEAAELLGHDNRIDEERKARSRAKDVEYAQGVLDIASGSRAGEEDDPGAAERLRVTELIDAEYLAELQRTEDLRTLAEQAAADRTWSFGHVIVDEAQELSPMVWRLLVRRCPTRSFTIIGDIAQTGSVSGATTWQRALEPFFGARWRMEQLTINYRTPAEIMAASNDVLTAINPELEPASAVRTGSEPPSLICVPAGELAARLGRETARAATAPGSGHVAVIGPESRLAALAEAVRGHVPDVSWGPEADLEQKIVILSATQSKGLEFDSVFVVDPGSLVTASSRGLNDLYVALTRSTQHLTVLCPGCVPELLASLRT